MNSEQTDIPLVARAYEWFERSGWRPFDFQTAAWKCYLDGYHGIVNAPTGSGKTYSLFVAILLEYLQLKASGKESRGLQAIWITPIRALSKEIEVSAKRALEGLGVDWEVGIRTGDTSAADKAKLRTSPPHFLITTPESLHLMLAQKNYPKYFKNLKTVVTDEWHELMGSKRGVQMELALSRLKSVQPRLKVWGISATIGNMQEALSALLGSSVTQKHTIVRSGIRKKILVESVFPEDLETLPWAGHIGIKLLQKVVPILKQSTSTLIFTNTRSFAEVWYQKILDVAPEMAGEIAMHHGSISRELRDWVEESLHNGQLKAVVCTSSLDLGVDFRPVETIIQVGSPKGVARFMQRAGRSGHRPGAISKIYFVPTHSLELIEAAALRQAIEDQVIEERIPYIRSFDVLIQYLITLAVSDGFDPKAIFKEVKGSFSYQSITEEEWAWILNFITTGGSALHAYDEYRKVIVENGLFKVDSRGVALRHRLSIGTIVGDNAMIVKYLSGKKIGTIEESFISKLMPGDVFWFGGRNLELVRIRGMEVQVRKSKRRSGKVPSWMGGRMPLSSEMSQMLRLKLNQALAPGPKDPELAFLRPLVQLQQDRSHLPGKDEFLIEYFKTREGYHVVMFPFEGRFVHEGIAALVAYRISRITPITFSIAMNDYGFELLSDTEIPIYEAVETDVLSVENLMQDIQASVNSTEMARRRFRDIASIAGLVFKGYPGHQIRERHIQASSQLFFEVFNDYESENLLLRQAFDEVMDFQLEEARMRKALEQINQQKIIITQPEKPTPFAFPIMVDRLSRDRLTNETMEERVKRMQLQFED